MTEFDSDADLLARARRQDQEAVAELYARHREAARRLAATYPRAGDADDVVNEAFFRILGAIERGAGPSDAFRAYLFVTVRRVAMEAIGRSRDKPFADVPEPVLAEVRSEVLDVTDRQIVLTAYGSLPSRQQAVLWQTAVEGRKPRELAPGLGLSANTVAAIASRARDQLREAYLQAHVAATPRPECEPHRSRLGAYVRDGLGRRNRTATQTHLGTCASCRDLVEELAEVNSLLARSLLPIFAGVSKAGLLIGAATAGGTAAGGLVSGGVTGAGGAAVRRLLAKARANPAAIAAAVVVAAGLALAMVSAVGGDGPQPEQTAPAGPAEEASTTVPLGPAAARPAPSPSTTTHGSQPSEPPTIPSPTTGTTTSPEPVTVGPAATTVPQADPKVPTTTTTAPADPPPGEPLPGATQASPSSTLPPSRPPVVPPVRMSALGHTMRSPSTNPTLLVAASDTLPLGSVKIASS
jgi:RNA polymerase sigma factor (sigma-70 family)